MSITAYERARRALPAADMGPLYAALAAAQGEFPPIAKNRTGHGYKYADIADVLEAVRPVLSRHGLALMQAVEGETLITTLAHSSGATISTSYPLVMDKAGRMNAIQSVGAALTYARRYALGALLGIAPDDDTDGVSAREGGRREEPTISNARADELRSLIDQAGTDEARFLQWAGVASLHDIPAARFNDARDALTKRIKNKEAA